jgi:hypothetical protein
MLEYEEARTALEQLRNWYHTSSGNRNEATTRLQLVDRIFFECLGWSRDSDVVLEEAQGPEYADYAFSCPSRMLIVEAKREGAYFELPVGQQRLEYSIPSLNKDFPSLKAALSQAASYAQGRGAPFAAVSNGHQIVAFVATRSDGVPPLDGHALVFPSLDFMVDKFHDLWQHLSRPAIAQSRLFARLVTRLTPVLPQKLAATITDYPGVKARNVLQTDLQILSELVLEDIARSPQLEATFLTETYCQSGALSQHALTSKKMLKARYDAIFDDASPGPTLVPTPDHKAGSHLLAESLSRRPVMLIGDVGVGKTTFIRRLLAVDAKEEISDAVALYIDFGSKATLNTEVGRWVVQQIKEQLKSSCSVDIEERNFVHGVYRGDVLDFRNGIYGDLREANPDLYRTKEVEFLAEKLKRQDEHVKRSLEHLSAGRRKQIVIFLDNADQRRDIEEQVFLVAHELASNWPASVFVTIRPETFHRSRTSGVLSGYHPKAFTISPPRIERVIEKRLQFAQKLTSGTIPIPALNTNLELSRLGSIIRSFERSLARNQALVECIDNLASGNVRLALDYVKSFFGSGHVDTKKISEIVESGEEYVIPVHEFLRAVIYGDAKHFSPYTSAVVNIFDVSEADPKEHFLMLMLIKLLHTESQSSTEAGFVSTKLMLDRLQDQGFTPLQVQKTIVRSHKGGLLETSGRAELSVDSPLPQSIRVTTKGLYHSLRLTRMFTYLDAMIVDTPVFDLEVRRRTHDVLGIGERIERARLAVEYLSSVWKRNDTRCDFFDWTEVAADIVADIEDVRRKTSH